MELQHLDERHKAKSVDAHHDLLLRLGDLSSSEIAERYLGDARSATRELAKQRRILEVPIAGERRWIAAEDASRYRDALGVPMPSGIPERFLQPVADPAGDLVLRYARTHGPFTPTELANRYGLGVAVVTSTLERFVERGRLVEGEFRPGGTQREWCDNEVLRIIRRRSLAKLRHEVEPVETPACARTLASWQGVSRKRRGLEALLETIETLQGYAMPASILEWEILAARVDDYRPSDLDMLSAAGEIVWVGVEPLGDRDGRVALYLTDHLPLLRVPSELPSHPVIDYLAQHGASFFTQIHAAIGGFPNDLIDQLWDLVWKGVVTNDTFHALRAFTRRARPSRSAQFRSRRTAPATTQGRWSLVTAPTATPTERANALAQQLLARYGVVIREVAAAESIVGGFSAVYPIFKAMEDAGRVRRGYFVAGLGATQFATAGALDLLRSFRDEPEEPETVLLAATDPANPYGALLKWPSTGLMRVPGASVILVNGALACYIARGEKQLSTFLPDDEPSRSMVAKEIARTLASLVENGTRRAMLITEVNDEPVARTPLAPFLAEAGFTPGSHGYQKSKRSLRNFNILRSAFAMIGDRFYSRTCEASERHATRHRNRRLRRRRIQRRWRGFRARPMWGPISCPMISTGGAVRRISQRGDEEIGNVLLNQRVVAGIGNIYSRKRSSRQGSTRLRRSATSPTTLSFES